MSAFASRQLSTSPTPQHDLASRIEGLGFTLLRIDRKHGVRVIGDVSRGVRAVINCTQFTESLRRRWEEISDHRGAMTELFPGVYLARLDDLAPANRVEPTAVPSLHAVLMLGPELLDAEVFLAACGQATLDTKAAATELAEQSLVGRTEALRMAQAFGWLREDQGTIQRRSGELQGLSLELADTYEELSLLYRMATSLRVTDSSLDILRDACEELHQVIGFKWLAISLIKDERLVEVDGQTIVASTGDVGQSVVEDVAGKLLTRIDSTSGSWIVDHSRELMIPEVEGIGQNLLIVPLRVENRVLGVMFGADRLDGDLISSVDAKLCESIAGSLTIYLENHLLYEDARGMFLGTLRALTAAIDAKDSYTHGHSERVALMAKMLAQAAGLDEAQCERVHLAGLVHDVGKIGVPEAVLCKPGRLTDEEFDMIKRHPEIGANIIRDIRQMNDLVPGVLYHHERFDGKGYPAGRAGLDIPLFGRLIGLADAFDAMSSDRTYRKAMSLDEVLKEVRDCSGTHFDPELAELFVGMDFEPFFEMIDRHQRSKTPA